MLAGNGIFSYNPAGATLHTISVSILSGLTGSANVDIDAVGW